MVYYKYKSGAKDGIEMNIYYILLLVVLALSLICQGRVKRVFKRYSDLPGALGITAKDAAENMLAEAGSNVTVVQVSGELTDHYAPKENTVGLSTEVYGSTSVAALAVAAHEIGHVCQYQDGYKPISIRTSILPVARIGSMAGPYIIIAGLLVRSDTVAYIGLYLYCAVLLFQLITLPVEFNASSRGLAMLESNGFVAPCDMPAAKKVLRAAAMTYVLSALGTLVSVLRFLTMIRGGKRRD